MAINYKIEIFDNDFILLKNDKNVLKEWQSYGKALYNSRLDFIDEVICSEYEICVKLNNTFKYSDIEKLQIEIKEKEISTRVLKMPILFDNNVDWKHVIQQCNMSREEIISLLLSSKLEVAMLGFLPGFIYMSGLPKELCIPRKANPKNNIEAGSFAIASKYAGLYSVESPGGWHVLGKMPCRVLNIPDIPPIILEPQDIVHLEEIGSIKYKELNDSNINILEYNGLT